MRNSVEQIINAKIREYNKLLSECSDESIGKALQFLQERRDKIHQSERDGIRASSSINVDELDGDIKEIFVLMEELKTEIKQIYIDNGEVLSHITSVAPENMEGGKIRRFFRNNNYETERGNWTFASSEAVDGRNAYMARQNGMIRINSDGYIYGGDIIDIQKDEYGDKFAILKKPNYVYEINPESFSPVMTLTRKRENGSPIFEFSQEWISEQEFDISDKTQVSDIREISDVTELLRHFQVFCDGRRYDKGDKLIGQMIIGNPGVEERRRILEKYLQSGELRYINGETRNQCE